MTERGRAPPPLSLSAGELGATAGTLSEWRDAFLASAEAGLKKPRVERT